MQGALVSSQTRRHLAEFWMLEVELAFASGRALLDLQERLLKHALRRLLSECIDDLRGLRLAREKGSGQATYPTTEEEDADDPHLAMLRSVVSAAASSFCLPPWPSRPRLEALSALCLRLRLRRLKRRFATCRTTTPFRF